MNLHTLLSRRSQERGPVRVGVIGAGKFASMFLTQALQPARAPRRRGRRPRPGARPRRAGAHGLAAPSATPRRASADALRSGRTYVTDDADELIDSAGIEVVLEITGNPIAGASPRRLARSSRAST